MLEATELLPLTVFRQVLPGLQDSSGRPCLGSEPLVRVLPGLTLMCLQLPHPCPYPGLPSGRRHQGPQHLTPQLPCLPSSLLPLRPGSVSHFCYLLPEEIFSVLPSSFRKQSLHFLTWDGCQVLGQEEWGKSKGKFCLF